MKPQHHVRTTTIEGRKFPRGVGHVRTVELCGQRIPVIRATVEQIPELYDSDKEQLNDGFFCLERLVIFLRAGQSKTHEKDSYLHEVVHAFLYLSGLKAQLRLLVGKKGDFEEIEEVLVRVATPHLVGLRGL